MSRTTQRREQVTNQMQRLLNDNLLTGGKFKARRRFDGQFYNIAIRDGKVFINDQSSTFDNFIHGWPFGKAPNGLRDYDAQAANFMRHQKVNISMELAYVETHPDETKNNIYNVTVERKKHGTFTFEHMGWPYKGDSGSPPFNFHMLCRLCDMASFVYETPEDMCFAFGCDPADPKAMSEVTQEFAEMKAREKTVQALFKGVLPRLREFYY